MNELLENAIYEVSESKKYLQSIQAQFADDPELLSIYEPSAKEMVNMCEGNLLNLLNKQAEVDFTMGQNREDIDVWIRIEGDSFHDGHGPIGAVGNFLQKFSKTTQKITSLIGGDIPAFPSFDLVQTAAGSLKLGLKRTAIESGNCLFPDEWERLKESAIQQNVAMKGIETLMEIMDMANRSDNPNELSSISSDEIDLYKFIYYTKDLTPSSRSPIEKISFEIRNSMPSGGSKKNITVDKQTRKNLMSVTKELGKNIEHIQITGVIRAIDIDNRSFVLRELEGKIDISEIETKFPRSFSPEQIANLLNKKVNASGFLKKDQSGRSKRFDVEEFSELTNDVDEDIE